MKLSVALCTYNGERYLPEQLQSIARQSRLPDELVVCDDGSSDSTLAILEAFALSSPFPVRIIPNRQNLGTTRNFEQAVCLCEGDLIALADQDDVWLPDKLQLSEQALVENPDAGLVFTDADVVNDQLVPVGFRIWQAVLFDEAKQRRLCDGQAFEVLLQRNVVTGATLMFRASYRDLIVPFDLFWVHDAWIAMMISLFAPITLVPQATILYRQHATNQIGITFPDGSDEFSTERTDIGSKPGLLARVRKTKWRDPHQLRLLHRQFGPVRDRMVAYDKQAGKRHRYRLFDQYIAHVGARGYLPKSRLRRLPTVIREFILLRYHRFSPGGILPFGASIALADLLWESLVDERDSVWARHYEFVLSQFRHSHAAFFDEHHFKQLTDK